MNIAYASLVLVDHGSHTIYIGSELTFLQTCGNEWEAWSSNRRTHFPPCRSSEEGQGTTVTISLPRRCGAVDGKEAEGAATDPSPRQASAVVMAVEDEPDMRSIAAEVLSNYGYTVLEAGDGRFGLSIAGSTVHTDLLVTDVGLPGGMNGRQLADAARRISSCIKGNR